MTKRCTFVLAFLAAQLISAQSALNVLASNGMKTVVDQLKPAAEKRIGRPMTIEFNSTSMLKPKLESGQGYDVAVVTTEMLDELIKSGKIVAASRVDLARGAIGLGVREGAPKPDIKTSEALKRALLNAKAVAYAKDGASRPAIDKMFDRMGIAEQMKSKIVLDQGSVRAAERVSAGDADFVLTLESEILPIKGVALVGPLPAEYQGYVSFAAGVAANAANPTPAQALVQFLASPANADVYKAKGLQPHVANH